MATVEIMMKNSLFQLTVLLGVLAGANAHAGAAICVAKERTPKNNETDAEYFLRWNGSVTGYKADVAARKDVKAKYSNGPAPYCRNTGNLVNGYFVVVKGVQQYEGEALVKYAFGYGKSSDEAKADAIRELKDRYWGWTQSKGYTVEETKAF